MNCPRIYTTYFANVRNLPDDMCPISISLYPPKGWTGLTYPPLYPTQEMLKHVKSTGDHRKYILDYTHCILDNLDKNQVRAELSQLIETSGKSSACLVCYEKPSSGFYCHRQIVGKWLDISEICSKHVDEISTRSLPKDETLF